MTKRMIIVLVAAAMLLLAPFGCKKAPVSIDGEALYQQMNALGQFPDMARRGGIDVYDYYGIDPAQCKQLVNYAAADGLMTDEFLFVESNDPALCSRHRRRGCRSRIPGLYGRPEIISFYTFGVHFERCSSHGTCGRVHFLYTFDEKESNTTGRRVEALLPAFYVCLSFLISRSSA